MAKVKSASAAVLLILGLCFGLAACQKRSEIVPITRTGPGALIIAYAVDSADTFAHAVPDSTTVLEWLYAVADSVRIPTAAQKYSYGVLVEGIGYRRNGEGGYWLYKVNGQMIPESAHSHRVSGYDTVLFFFDER